MMDNPATDPAEGWRRCAIGRARSPVKATIASNGRLSLGEDCSASTRDLHGCTKFLIYNSGKNLKKGWQGLTTSGFSSWAKFSPLHPTAASDNWFKAWVTIPSQSPLNGWRHRPTPPALLVAFKSKSKISTNIHAYSVSSLTFQAFFFIIRVFAFLC